MPAPQARTASAGPNKRRATSGFRLAAAIAQPAPWPMHQAVLASAPAITSITWARVLRCNSSPPSDRGSRSRNSLASCSAATISAGSARAASIRSAEARRRSRPRHGRGRPHHPRVGVAGRHLSLDVVDLCPLASACSCRVNPARSRAKLAPIGALLAMGVRDMADREPPGRSQRHAGAPSRCPRCCCTRRARDERLLRRPARTCWTSGSPWAAGAQPGRAGRPSPSVRTSAA